MAKKQSRYISRTLWLILGVLSILFVGVGITQVPSSFASSLSPSFSTQAGPFDFANQTIELNGQKLAFKNGLYESSDARHSARITDRSVNASISKAAAILIDSPEGSGTFYYVVGATRQDGRERYSEPAFLGDRILIESVNVDKESITVRYLDRPANASMVTPPTVRVTATYTFQAGGNLSRVK